ncbi:hypothetical protein EYF80_011640 [Liparis tanakae]|uniref:Uncharacterized protein n=1 Tax=Liparis tanakae TaxID=230148 RepID=A0A4Z2IK03_9TELE|nr:hypothetical protein EYF80_011640 [Liparis tanakae]
MNAGSREEEKAERLSRQAGGRPTGRPTEEETSRHTCIHNDIPDPVGLPCVLQQHSDEDMLTGQLTDAQQVCQSYMKAERRVQRS